jgi:hypothetical protein
MSTPRVELPAVVNAPPPRCYHRSDPFSSTPCGELARWQRPGRDWFCTEYFCDAHRGPADTAIAAEHVFRRFTLSVELYISGAAINAPVAQHEAMSRLESAMRSIGAICEVINVRNSMVRSWPQAGRVAPIGAGGGGE